MENNTGGISVRQKKLPTWLVLAAILIPAGIVAYSALLGDMGLTYALTDEGVHIQHKGASVLIPAEDRLIRYSEILEVRLLDQLPKLRKEFGKNGLRTWVGDFSSEELGDVKAYILNVKWPIVMIKTGSETILLSPQNAVAFVEQIRTATGK